MQNRRFLLTRRPNGTPVEADFEHVVENVREINDGEFLVRNIYASLDPAQRGWMDDVPSYIPPIPLGDAVRATCIGQVTQSRSNVFKENQWIIGHTAIEDYTVCSDQHLRGFWAIGDHRPLSNYISGLGTAPMTAYFGLLVEGQPKANDTVLVSGAAGSVGSTVGQIAKLKGCKTIGIAGGKEKCERLLKNYGFDFAIDYKGLSQDELEHKIAELAPEGIDIIFENVGGEIFDASLKNIKVGGRAILCGLISDYNRMDDPHGCRAIWQLIVKRAQIIGINLGKYFGQADEAQKEIAQWIAEDKLKFDEHIEVGIENALPAFLKLFNGENKGKMMLQIQEDYKD